MSFVLIIFLWPFCTAQHGVGDDMSVLGDCNLATSKTVGIFHWARVLGAYRVQICVELANGVCVANTVTPKAVTLRAAIQDGRQSDQIAPTLQALVNKNPRLGPCELKLATESAPRVAQQTELAQPFPDASLVELAELEATQFPWGKELASPAEMQETGVCFVDFLVNAERGDYFPTRLDRKTALEAELEMCDWRSGDPIPLNADGSIGCDGKRTLLTILGRADRNREDSAIRPTSLLVNTMAAVCLRLERESFFNYGMLEEPSFTARDAPEFGDFDGFVDLHKRTTIFCFRSHRRAVEYVLGDRARNYLIVPIERAMTIMYGKAPSRTDIDLEKEAALLATVAYEMSKTYGVSLETALTRGRLAISREALRHSAPACNTAPTILPPPRYGRPISAKRGGASTARYDGGYILNEAPGLYGLGNRERVIVVDFDSHYPAIMTQDADALPRIYMFRPDDPEEQYTSKTYRRFIKSILSTKRRESSTGPFRDAVKLLANAFYGSLGSMYSPIYCVRAAAEITRIGRERLGALVDFIRKRGRQVCFGHTDSVAYVNDDGLETNLGVPFNSEHSQRKHECVTVERCFGRVWSLSRTSYAGLLIDARADDSVSSMDVVSQILGVAWQDLATPPDHASIAGHARAAAFCQIQGSRRRSLQFTRRLDDILHTSGVLTTLFPPIINALSLTFLALFLWQTSDEELEKARDVMRDVLTQWLAPERTPNPEEKAAFDCDLPETLMWCTDIEYKASATALGARNDANFRKFLSVQMRDAVRSQGRGTWQRVDRTMRVYRDFARSEYRILGHQDTAHGDGETTNLFSVDKPYWIGRFLDHWEMRMNKTLDAKNLARARAILEPLVNFCDRNAPFRASAASRRSLPSANKRPEGQRIAQIMQTLPGIPSSLPDIDAIARKALAGEDLGDLSEVVDTVRPDLAEYVESLTVATRGQSEIIPILFDPLLGHVDILEALRRNAQSGSVFAAIDLDGTKLVHLCNLYRDTVQLVAGAYAALAAS